MLNRQRTALLQDVERLARGFLERAVRLGEQVDSLSWAVEDDPLEQLQAVEQRAEDLRERLDDELEAAQLGMAVEVISHEFGHHIRDIRSLVRALGPWGNANQELAHVVRDLRRAFEHLDGYLTLFTPLHRRLYRATTTFTGSDLEAYLRRLFGARLSESTTELVATSAFLETMVTGYPSTYYPVVVNLVDNAIWWVRECRERRVTLETSGGSLVVSDTGPGVGPTDRDRVFDRGFTLKPGGRGLGLTIARDSMRRIGGDVVIDDSTGGARFLVVLPSGAGERG